MKYFILRNNLDIPNRWFLSPFQLPKPFSIWEFTKTGPLSNDYSGLSVGTTGNIVTDFTFAEFAIPVINDRTAYLLPSSEIQLIRLKAGIFNNLSVLILLSELDCLDESQSIFTKFDETSSRPDLIGHYRNIYKVVLDKSKCDGHSIFRIKGFIPYIIVNENIKNSLINNHIKGILFKEV